MMLIVFQEECRASTSLERLHPKGFDVVYVGMAGEGGTTALAAGGHQAVGAILSSRWL